MDRLLVGAAVLLLLGDTEQVRSAFSEAESAGDPRTLRGVLLWLRVVWALLPALTAFVFGYAAYVILCVGLWGRTLGYLLCGIRVVRLDGGKRVGLQRAFARHFAGYGSAYVPFAGPALRAADYLWLLRGRRVRRMGRDVVAGTALSLATHGDA